MKRSETLNFILVLFATIFNVFLANIAGGDGFLAFITTCIALAILLTFITVQLLNQIYKTGTLSLKITSTPSIIILWFVAVLSVAMIATPDVYKPGFDVPQINPYLVGLGAIALISPKLRPSGRNITLNSTAIAWMATIYSIVVLFIAGSLYYGLDENKASLVIIIAVQLQYLMNYAVVQTGYLDRLQHLHSSNFFKKTSSESLYTIQASLFLLPFFLPLAIIFIVGVILK